VKYYIAYGSNLNLDDMKMRCKGARFYKKGILKDYQLVFRWYATIEKKEGAITPVGVFCIDEKSELELDFYEGYPTLYRKENVNVELEDGSLIECMVYIMEEKRQEYTLPSKSYYATIEKGYKDVGLDISYLKQALEYTKKLIQQ
jgi:cation transport regulator ChaC